MIEFDEKIRLLSDKELLEVIKSKEDYQEEFWKLAVKDAEKRGLKSKSDKIIEEFTKKKAKIEDIKQEKQFKETSLTELYSDKAIIGFSIFFTSIAGAILFSQNLKTLKKSGGDQVIFFGIIYFILTLLLAYALPSGTLKELCALLNIAGGYIITIYFGSKFYPEKLKYKNKKIWNALLIALLIYLGIFGLIILAIKGR